MFGRIPATFQESLFAEKRDFGLADETPIFVLGMPRSGKTLVERILCRHPLVRGAGEAHELSRIVARLPRRLGGAFPEAVAKLTAAQALELGKEYAEPLRRRFPEAMRVVDTKPANFALIGLIRLILPRARIVHCTRDALDNCLFCYFENFNTQPYSTDLADLGHYYAQYRRIMDHWRAVLPGQLCEVKYEDLIADPIRESRRIYEFCGLGWDVAFAGLNETSGAEQFPITLRRDEIGRWRRYERHLEPLRRIIETAERPGTACPTAVTAADVSPA